MTEGTLKKQCSTIDQTKDTRLSIIFSLAVALAFGSCHLFASVLSMKLSGTQAFKIQSYAQLIMWLLYHVYIFICWKMNSDNQGQSYFTQANSQYFEKYDVDQEVESSSKQVQDSNQANHALINNKKTITLFSWVRTSVILIRSVVAVTVPFLITNCFFYAFKSGVNAGIIASLFATSSFFTILIFRFKYGQLISQSDFVGTMFIFACVVLIGAGEGQGGDDKTYIKVDDSVLQEQKKNLMISVFIAILTGLVFALTGVTIKYTLDVGFNLMQSFFDSLFVAGICTLPFLFKDYAQNPKDYTYEVFLLAFATQFLGMMGILLLSKALQYGKAGPVTAIENTKTIIQTILGSIYLGVFPSLMQWIGLASGFIGILFIIFQKEKEDHYNKV